MDPTPQTLPDDRAAAGLRAVPVGQAAGKDVVAVVADDAAQLNRPTADLIAAAKTLPAFADRAVADVQGVMPCTLDGRTVDPRNLPPSDRRRWKRDVRFVSAQASAMLR